MLRIYFSGCLVIFILSISCNAPPPSNEIENEQDSTLAVAAAANDTFDIPSSDEVSNIIVGKGSCKVLQDSLGIRMTECTVMPGDSVKVHKHPDHAVYVLQGGKLAVWFNGSTQPIEMELPTGASLIGGPLSDVAKNIGKTPIRLLNVDLYRPRR